MSVRIPRKIWDDGRFIWCNCNDNWQRGRLLVMSDPNIDIDIFDSIFVSHKIRTSNLDDKPEWMKDGCKNCGYHYWIYLKKEDEPKESKPWEATDSG